MLHSKVSVNATSRVQEDAPGHSILQHDMPDDEDLNCEDARKKKLSPAAHPSCLFLGKAPTVISEKDWQSWFCQFLGVPIPALGPFECSERVAGGWAVRARANPLSLGVWPFTLRFILPRSWVGYRTLAEGRKAVACSRPCRAFTGSSFAACLPDPRLFF